MTNSGNISENLLGAMAFHKRALALFSMPDAQFFSLAIELFHEDKRQLWLFAKENVGKFKPQQIEMIQSLYPDRSLTGQQKEG